MLVVNYGSSCHRILRQYSSTRFVFLRLVRRKMALVETQMETEYLLNSIVIKRTNN